MSVLAVPADHPTLQGAVDAASPGDVVELHGRVESPRVRIHKPLTLRGAPGAALVGVEAVVLNLHADVTVEDLRIEGGGHGVVCLEGSPVLRRLRLSVTHTAVACGQACRPTLRDLDVQHCGLGFTFQDDAVVDAADLRVVSRGSGLFALGRAAGTVRGMTVFAGQLAGAEITGESTLQVEGLAVLTSGGGGLFVHGDARPTLRAVRVERVQLAGLEVAERATPTVDGLVVRQGAASGVFCHDQARLTLLEADLADLAQVGLMVWDQASVEAERLAVADVRMAGVWARHTARVEVLSATLHRCGVGGVELADEASAELEDVEVVGTGGPGLSVGDRARLRGRRVQVREGSGPGGVVADAASLVLVGGAVLGNLGPPLAGSTTGSVTVRGVAGLPDDGA